MDVLPPVVANAMRGRAPRPLRAGPDWARMSEADGRPAPPGEGPDAEGDIDPELCPPRSAPMSGATLWQAARWINEGVESRGGRQAGRMPSRPSRHGTYREPADRLPMRSPRRP